MIDALQAYPEYKDVDISWAAMIPANWKIRRAKNLFHCIDVRSNTGTEERLTVSAEHGVVPRHSMKVTMFEAKSYIGHKLCWPGDLVINSLWAWGRGLGVARHHGLVSSAYGVYRLNSGFEEYTPFIHHLVRSKAYHWELRTRSKGVWISRLQLTDDAFLRSPILVPPVDDAKAITRFIRDMDRRTNAFIRNRRRLIEVLNEQRRSTIRAFVTQGTHASVKMRDTALEQFPVLPAHWEESRVKREFTNLDHKRIPLSTTVRGEMTTREYDYYGASGVIDRVEDYIFDDELLLIAEDGANLVLRNLPLAIIARGKFWVNNHAHILKPKRGNIEYFAHVLELVDYRPWVTGAAQPKLTRDRLMRVGIPAPPIEEQQEIVSAINSETRSLTEGITKAQREIELIREYRDRLISDVVTGKVDVRGLAPAEPPLDDEQIDESIDEGMLGDDEPELVEETPYADS